MQDYSTGGPQAYSKTKEITVCLDSTTYEKYYI